MSTAAATMLLAYSLLVALVSAAKWTYPYSATQWAGKCLSGKAQSPVDLPRTDKRQHERITYLKLTKEVRGAKVNMLAFGGKVTGGNGLGFTVPKGYQMVTPHTGRSYNLAQLHFHTGSEHTVEGEQFDMELHFVHSRAGRPVSVSAEDGDLAVVGVLFKLWDGQGRKPKSVQLMQKLLKSMKCKKDRDCVWATRQDKKVPVSAAMDPTEFMRLAAEKDKHRFWTYKGGLTTPGCTEIVSWHVYMEPLLISQAQINRINSLQGQSGNYRPVKELNGRAIQPADMRAPPFAPSWHNGPRTHSECYRAHYQLECESFADACSWDGEFCHDCSIGDGDEDACNQRKGCAYCERQDLCLPQFSERLCACSDNKLACKHNADNGCLWSRKECHLVM